MARTRRRGGTLWCPLHRRYAQTIPESLVETDWMKEEEFVKMTKLQKMRIDAERGYKTVIRSSCVSGKDLVPNLYCYKVN